MAKTENNEKVLNVGLASFGMSGQVFHAPFIDASPHFSLHSVVERNSNKATTRYPEINIVRGFEELVSLPEIDLVIVNVPNALHFQFTKLALEAGKHVIVEKPFTNTLAEADELIKLANSKGQVLSVYQNRRYDSDFLTVKKVLQSGLLGKVVEFEAHYDRFRNYIEPATWKENEGPGSGLLYNLGSHLIDQALVLFGFPQFVYADLRAQRPDSQVVDGFELILGYEGLKVSLKSSYLAKIPAPRYTLHGLNGSFVKYGTDVQEQALKDGFSPNSKNWGQEPEAIFGRLETNFSGLNLNAIIESEGGNYGLYYYNVYKAIVGQADLEVKPEQARDVIAIIEAAQNGAKQKRAITL